MIDDTEREVIRLDWRERDKVQIPPELLELLARALVPAFQQYMKDKQARDKLEE